MEMTTARSSSSPVPQNSPAAAHGPQAALDRVRRKLKVCQQLLTAPTAASVLSCGGCMEDIRSELESLLSFLPAAAPECVSLWRGQVQELAGEFRHARQLLESAAGLYQGWADVLGSYWRGYTRSGTPAALRHGTETLLQA
jgi:hypothetical protein